MTNRPPKRPGWYVFRWNRDAQPIRVKVTADGWGYSAFWRGPYRVGNWRFNYPFGLWEPA